MFEDENLSDFDTDLAELDIDLADVLGAVCGRIETAGYDHPLVAFRHMDEVREIQVDDEVEREDDIRLLEMILQQTGLALPGAVAFCRHEAQGYYAVVVEDRDISFLHLMNGEEGWFASEVPRPNFWAVQPNRHAQEGETGMVQ